MKLSIGITSVLDVVPFVRFPPQAEGFSLGDTPWLLVEAAHVIAIRGGLFLCVSKDDCGYGPFVAFSEGTALVGIGGWDLWFDDVSIVDRVIFEATVFGEAIFMGSMPPGAGGLIPLGVIFGHGDVGIAE